MSKPGSLFVFRHVVTRCNNLHGKIYNETCAVVVMCQCIHPPLVVTFIFGSFVKSELFKSELFLYLQSLCLNIFFPNRRRTEREQNTDQLYISQVGCYKM